MRILLDMQGCQSASRLRGIGRYTMSLAKAIARNAGEHEIWLLLSDLFPESVMPLRQHFAGLVPDRRIAVFSAPRPIAECDARNSPRARVAELVREHAIAELAPDIVHLGSLFEGFVDDAVTSIGALTREIPTAVTLYDLIPLLNPDTYLGDKIYREYYLRKVEWLKRADLVLAISGSAGQEAMLAADIPAERLVDIAAAADERFRPPDLAPEATGAVLKRFGLSRPFVLYVGAIEPRKNFEGLIRAFAALRPETRDAHQLLLVAHGGERDRERLHALAASLGLRHPDLLTVDHVSDDDLVALYALCRLFVFPSLHEGFGLPALEALSCGAAVIGSSTTSVPEVIGWDDAQFDPGSPASIAGKMQRALTDEAFRRLLVEHGSRQAKRFSWDATARRALDAMVAVSRAAKAPVGSVAQGTLGQPRMAFVSPLPPQRTGIADYAAELLPELARYYDITLITSLGETSAPWIAGNLPLRSVDWFLENAASFTRVLYQFGNSPFHAHMFSLLERHPGVVVLHDFFLSAVLNWMEESGYEAGAFARALYESHGYRALIRSSKEARDVIKRDFPASLPVIQGATGLIVHSHTAEQMAKGWFGETWAERIRRVPFPRRARDLVERAEARKALALPEDAFVVCSFGALSPTKLNHRLLSAWAGSGLARDQDCYLVFVGENHGGDYGSELLQAIGRLGCGSRIAISGFVENSVYEAHLAAADAAVQLRTMSRGETSAAVFDCMANGVPLIANAHGSAAELPADTLMLIGEDFRDDELAQALRRLRENGALRSELRGAARDYVTDRHSPAQVAAEYRDVIENSASVRSAERYRTLVEAAAQAGKSFGFSDHEWLATAASIAMNARTPHVPQILMDVSEISHHDLRTGIERAARGLLMAFVQSPPRGWRPEPVYRDSAGFRYARRFLAGMLKLPDSGLMDELVEARSGDIYLGLEWSPEGISKDRPHLEAMRRKGVFISFVVYDILPLQFPDQFPDFIGPLSRQWMEHVAHLSDALLCISKATATAVLEWLTSNPPKRQGAVRVSWFHLGADIAHTAPTVGLPSAAAALLQTLRARPTFVMVGTLEPRKGHRQALEAFDGLWQRGKDVNLVIVGKKGWMMDAFVKRLRAHPEMEKRLFWLEGISDEYLEAVYRAATCLIAASEAEGYGLPLIEAAQHGLPIIARDMPVFREVAREHAHYFKGDSPAALASAIIDWMGLAALGRAPSSSGVKPMSWAESTQQLWAGLQGEYFGLHAPEEVRAHALRIHLLLIHKARVRIVQELLPEGEYILDLGGANSPLHKMGYPHRFKRLTMIDLPEEARHEMYKELIVDGTCDSGEVVVRYQDMTSLEGIDDGTIDFVWSGQSIEHVPPEAGERMCREAWRVLRPDGIFALDTANRLLTRIHTRPSGGGFIHPEPYVEYLPDQLAEILESAGFRIEKRLGICGMPETVRTQEFHYEDFLYGPAITDNVEGAYIQFYICRKPAEDTIKAAPANVSSGR